MKKALDVDEQITKLKEHGMKFDNEPKAKEILLDIGYYRLGFYSFPFEQSFPNLKNRDHKLNAGTTFKSVVDLYYFDSELRKILMNALNRIEVNIRTTITYTISNHYKHSPTWFVDPSIMSSKFISSFDELVYKQIKENSVIQRHHKTHINDKYAPAWKTLEFMTIGNICHLVKNVKNNNLLKIIAQKYGCSTKVFLNYLDAIRITRNKCAHGSCLYNITLPKGVHREPANIAPETRLYISGLIGVIHYIMGKISINRQQEFAKDINQFYKDKITPDIQRIIEDCTKINLLDFVDSE